MQQPEQSIGHRDDMSELELAGKVVDSLTGFVFETMDDYANHVSPVTGFTPKDPEHFGTRFIRQSEAALKRTKSDSEDTRLEMNRMLDNAKAADVDYNLSRTKVEVEVKAEEKGLSLRREAREMEQQERREDRKEKKHLKY